MSIDPIPLVAGLALVTIAMLDALWTTLWVDGGAGPLSRVVMASVRALFNIRGGRDHPHLRSVGGPVMLSATLGLWILLLWCGWSLVFLADASSLVSSTTRAPAGFMDAIYFAGYSIFTLGNGDFSPQGAAWQLATTVAAGTGLVIITLGITYLLSILSAQVDQRAAAALVLDAASDPVELVRALRADGSWPGLQSWARDMASKLGRTTDQHLAYPVLHFMAGGSRSKSPAVAVAVLDEAMTILRHGFDEESRPKGFSLDALAASLGSYASTMEESSRLRLDEVPPAPMLAALRADGAPVIPQGEFEARLTVVEDRRRRLLALVKSNGWSWSGRDG